MKVDHLAVAQSLFEEIGTVSPFPGSQFPYPLNQSLFGELNLEALRHSVENSYGSQVKEELPILLALAEAVEASQPDKKKFFIHDRELRARLLGLNSADGWALLWGRDDERTAELAAQLQKEHLQVYAVLAEDNNTPSFLKANRQHKFLGSRPTSSVYFYQAIIRYAHIYGRIPVGDAHEASEFIQDDGPAVMLLAREELSPLEEMLFLGGLYLGLPGVVPSSYSVHYGTVLRADDPKKIVSQALNLPNLRLRRRLRFQINIPYDFDATYTSEEIKEGYSIGGTPASSFVVTNLDKGDGIEVEGEHGPDVGIEIAVGDRRVDISMTDYLEEFAAQLLSYIQGVFSEVKDGCLVIRWRTDVPLQMAQLGQAYYDGLKAHFKIDRLKIRLVFNPHLLDKMNAEAEDFRQKRERALAAANEETEPFFYACTRCHSFALEHTCIVTPERLPQCGSRTWMHIKTRALLSDFDSRNLGMRQSGAALQAVAEKGLCLDAEKGEYEGVNTAMATFTEGRTRRVFLHSLFEHPHTACSCFQCVGFYIEGVDGIGVMPRTYKGIAPDGRSWNDIANTIAGKQASGFVGFDTKYLHSPKFLQADGGLRRVVWMPQELKKKFASDKDWIATEADAKNLEELTEFLKDKKMS